MVLSYKSTILLELLIESYGGSVEKVYVGQTKLRIKIKTNIDLSTIEYETVNLKVLNPAGNNTQSWIATIDDEEEGIVYFDLSTMIYFDEEGDWVIWPEIIFYDNKKAYGTPVVVKVYNEGQ